MEGGGAHRNSLNHCYSHKVHHISNHLTENYYKGFTVLSRHTYEGCT